MGLFVSGDGVAEWTGTTSTNNAGPAAATGYANLSSSSDHLVGTTAIAVSLPGT